MCCLGKADERYSNRADTWHADSERLWSWIQECFPEGAEDCVFWIRCRFPETIEGREVTDESNE